LVEKATAPLPWKAGRGFGRTGVGAGFVGVVREVASIPSDLVGIECR
jgi:hypothetical protein